MTISSSDSSNYAQYQALGQITQMRRDDVCRKSIRKHGCISKFYIMKKLNVDYQTSKRIALEFDQIQKNEARNKFLQDNFFNRINLDGTVKKG
jgi:hypothetical protein